MQSCSTTWIGKGRWSTMMLGALLGACDGGEIGPVESKSQPPQATVQSPGFESRRAEYSENREACAEHSNLRVPLYGDLHVHTSLSFDAVAGRIKIMPEDAFDYARGKRISFFPQDEQGEPSGETQIDRPLDFAAITDHSEFLGERALCTDHNSSEFSGEFCEKYRKIEFRGSMMLATVLSKANPERIKMLCGADGERCREATIGPWQRITDAAESAYDRSKSCKFTSFVGYEYSGSPAQSNYHRNVIFRNGNVPELPLSYIEAPLDYLLWDQLDAQCNKTNNCDYLTIPHNSNLSNGKLLTPFGGLQKTRADQVRYARTRLRREPLVEIFQHKGASECINGLNSVLGAVDELCDIEQVRVLGQNVTTRYFHLEGADLVIHDPESSRTSECEEGEVGSRGMFAGGCVSRNDFLRTALITGLELEQEIDVNPLKMGIIASTDGHFGTPGAVQENKWHGAASGEVSADERLKPGKLPTGIKGNPGGLAGVWSEENSRDAIFDAMMRRETFGTSGPRIAPRFFGGWDLDADSCSRPDMIEHGYAHGVPMGGDLHRPPAPDQKPKFLLSAHRDIGGQMTPLQQLQVIKGWVDADGKRRYTVHTVAGTADNGAGVNVTTGKRYGKGHDSLCGVFTDEGFDPELPSFYYLRAVENPSPRWSLLDCLKRHKDDRPAVCQDPTKQIIQEMAWSSPIWFTPEHPASNVSKIP